MSSSTAVRLRTTWNIYVLFDNVSRRRVISCVSRNVSLASKRWNTFDTLNPAESSVSTKKDDAVKE
jgi:CRISPR/Cas system endoribonuclease Cas6 (RAMP superfamily)